MTVESLKQILQPQLLLLRAQIIQILSDTADQFCRPGVCAGIEGKYTVYKPLITDKYGERCREDLERIGECFRELQTLSEETLPQDLIEQAQLGAKIILAAEIVHYGLILPDKFEHDGELDKQLDCILGFAGDLEVETGTKLHKVCKQLADVINGSFSEITITHAYAHFNGAIYLYFKTERKESRAVLKQAFAEIEKDGFVMLSKSDGQGGVHLCVA